MIQNYCHLGAAPDSKANLAGSSQYLTEQNTFTKMMLPKNQHYPHKEWMCTWILKCQAVNSISSYQLFTLPKSRDRKEDKFPILPSAGMCHGMLRKHIVITMCGTEC